MRPKWEKTKEYSPSSRSCWSSEGLLRPAASGPTTPTLSNPSQELTASQPVLSGPCQKGALLCAWDHPQTAGSV